MAKYWVLDGVDRASEVQNLFASKVDDRIKQTVLWSQLLCIQSSELYQDDRSPIDPYAHL